MILASCQSFRSLCSFAERVDLFGPVEAFGLLGPEALFLIEAPARKNYTNAMRRKGLFNVRPAHMAAFQPEAERAFEQGLVAHLRKHHTEIVEEIPDAALTLMVRSGIKKARQYGLETEANIGAFVGLMFEIAPNFDTHPYIYNILMDFPPAA